MSDLKQRLSRLTPEQRARLEQQLLKRGAAAAEQAIPRRASTGPCPLSFCQQRLWFLDQLAPGTATYNVPNALHLRGPLHAEALRQAVEAVVRRHEVLRTTYAGAEGGPVQIVQNEWPPVFQERDLRGQPEGVAEQICRHEAGRPFDLARDVMLRATLLRLGDEEFIFLFVTHHIAWDLRSKLVFYQELAALYAALAAGRPSPLAELPIQYSDFAVWQRQQMQGEPLAKLAAYWKGCLAGAAPKLELPADRPRPPVQSLRGGKYFFQLSPALVEAAKALARRESVTPYMTLLASFQTFLLASSGQEDISVGTPIAGRNRVETEPLIGFFINTLLMRTDLSGNPTFQGLLKRVREVTLGAYAHQEMPFEKLVEVVKPPRDLSRNPLFQVNFRVANAPPAPFALPGLAVRALELIDNATSKFDLALELGTEGNSSYLEYSSDLFAEATVVEMCQDYQRLLGELLGRPDVPLQALPAFAEIDARRRAKPASKSSLKGFRDARRQTVPR